MCHSFVHPTMGRFPLGTSNPGWLQAAAEEGKGDQLSQFSIAKTRRVMGKPRSVGHPNTEESDLSTAQVCRDYSWKSLTPLPVLRKNCR